MTVIAHDQRDQYTASAGQTVFSYTFEITDEAYLKVYKRAALSTPNDAANLLTLTADYTVTNVGGSNGGSVVLTVGATLGDIVTIVGSVPAERDTSFTPGGLIRAEDLNSEFDNQTLIQQKIQTIVDDLIPKYAYNAVIAAADRLLPILPADYIWRMNATRTAIEAIPFTDSDRASVLRADLSSHASGKGASMVGLFGTGTVQDLSNAPFLVQTTNAATPNAQVLATLATGILKSTTATGVVTIAVQGTDYYAPGGTDVAVIDGGTGASNKTEGFDNLSPAVNKGDLIVSNGSDNVRLPVGTDGQVLIADSAETAGIKWLSAGGTIPFTTKGDILTYDGTTNMRLGVGTNNYALVADSGTTSGLAYKEVVVLTAGAATANINMGGFKITNAIAPTNASDYATKDYVDNVAQNIHLACDYATVAGDVTGWVYDNGVAGVGATLEAPAPGLFNTDGVAPDVAKRVLVKDADDPAYNGAYVVTTNDAGSNGLLTRATDYDQASQMQAGDKFTVVGGTTLAATEWMMTQTAAITVGTTDLTFAPIAVTGALLKANNLSDIPSPSTARTNLGLGTAAVQNVGAFLQPANNLSEVSNAGTARTNLGLAIGTNVQAYNVNLATVSAPTPSSVLVSNSSSQAEWSATMINGQILIGRTGNTPLPTTLTAGANITITNGSGSITISSTAGGTTNISDIMLLMGA